MAHTRFEKQETKVSDADKKPKESEHPVIFADYVTDVNKKNPFLKTPMKRRREDKKEEESPAEKRSKWLNEKAKKAIIPNEASEVLKPEHIFMETGPLVIYLCSECRKYNSTREVSIVGEGKMQLPLGMCSICRHHLNRQRNVKFFEHELPARKREQGL